MKFVHSNYFQQNKHKLGKTKGKQSVSDYGSTLTRFTDRYSFFRRDKVRKTNTYFSYSSSYLNLARSLNNRDRNDAAIKQFNSTTFLQIFLFILVTFGLVGLVRTASANSTNPADIRSEQVQLITNYNQNQQNNNKKQGIIRELIIDKSTSVYSSTGRENNSFEEKNFSDTQVSTFSSSATDTTDNQQTTENPGDQLQKQENTSQLVD